MLSRERVIIHDIAHKLEKHAILMNVLMTTAIAGIPAEEASIED